MRSSIRTYRLPRLSDTLGTAAAGGAGALPVNTVAPAITGNNYPGQTLTATPGTWDNADSVGGQWLRDGVAISGATAATYELTLDDASSSITYRETATNASGSATAASSAIDTAASWQIEVTASGLTYTLSALTVTASTTVQWGDGNSDAYTGSGARSHVYAGAGTYTVSIVQPQHVTTWNQTGYPAGGKIHISSRRIRSLASVFDFRLQSAPAGSTGTFNSADVAGWNPATFRLNAMPAGYAGTFDSADVAGWNPADFRLFSMPAGYAGTFDSADVAGWDPDSFRLASMPSGYAGTFDSADVAGWDPATFHLLSMPAATFTFVVSAGGFAAWTKTTDFRVDSNALLQAQVDQILADFYAAFPSRTATGGSINVGGSNAAPSGVLQAACPPDEGKEYAYELANDSCTINPTKKWATVTITT